VDRIASSKRRGVNRATWSMHLKGPKVPPAASAMYGAQVGPRVVPGTYTVKMTKGDQVYTTKLQVALDPRAKFTVEDRKAQFDMVVRLGSLLNHMSWAVDAIIGVRDAAQQRAAGLPASDPLRSELTGVAAAVDQIRTKIVATKEGGMITGEERLREYLGGLYGDVNGYEGRPTDSQTARAEALARELEDVIREFTGLAGQRLMSVNRGLQAKGLPAIGIVSEADWRKAHAEELE
jgi:hypothetical protein